MINCNVPFARMSCCITVGLHRPSQRKGVHWHPTAVPWVNHPRAATPGGRRVAAYHVRFLRTGRMIPAQYGAAGRRASRCRRIGLPEHHTLFGKGIQIRCVVGRRLIDVIALHILPAQVVRQNQYHVGFRPFCCAKSGRRMKSDERQRDRIKTWFQVADEQVSLLLFLKIQKHPAGACYTNVGVSTS